MVPDRLLVALFLLTFPIAACDGSRDPAARREPAPADAGPRLVALGTAQDGGLPHAACRCQRCETARIDPDRRRLIAGAAVVIPETRGAFLVDATPDIRPQLDRLRGEEPAAGVAVNRAPVNGVLLTHAHLGHYTGLAFFGFEAIHSRQLPVFCTAAMASYLRANGPWSQLVEIGNVEITEIRPGVPFLLGDRVSVTPLAVPHRDEYGDTVGFLFEGSRSRVLYVPDTDSWGAWDPPLETVVETVDVAILDGTFFSPDELPGRDVASIGHPLIRDTMDRLERRVRSGRLAVYFTHLNHSNPALDPGGDERREIRARGFHVLDDGDSFPL